MCLAQDTNCVIGANYLRMTFRFAQNLVNTETGTRRFFMGQHNVYSLDSERVLANDEVTESSI